MRFTVVILGAAQIAAVVCEGAQSASCRLKKGLYQQRQALASPPRGPRTDGAAREALDQQYFDFFRGLSEAGDGALQSCCSEAGDDRIGRLSCQLVGYISGGRTDSAGFLNAFPGGKKEVAALWELDALAAGAVEHGVAVPQVFQGKGPSYRFIDELFLLVLDGNEEAIAKYFNLAGSVSAERARYVDAKLALLLREAPAVLVGKWFVLRHHKQKLKSVLESIASAPAENQRLRRGIEAFCSPDDPDCAEILKLFKP